MGQFCSPSRQTTKEKAKKRKKEKERKETHGGHMGRPTVPATCTTAQSEVACPLMSHKTSWEIPRGRFDEHNSKFSLGMKPKFNRPVGERNHF
jgi:hypothetical protein